MVCVFIANGTEEIEALTPVDFLRRSGIEVVTVGVGGLTVKGAHDIAIGCDIAEKDLEPDDRLEAVILPGGMPGTLNLESSDAVNRAVDYCVENGKLICAICAAPSILGHKGLLEGREACCFPGFEGELRGANVSERFVCRDEQYITAKGMGSALSFSHAIVSALRDKKTADRVRDSLQVSVD
ncbi:MAG: DJ-1/PfpI family protein [Clostridia bacterium]|nr:DJ-1/PfpI family protein [Clostridia bacterium]